MPKPRKSLISLDATPYYHCISRCVRHAFLCGEDPVSGRSYEHRRQWVEERLLELARVFAIDLCAYAVMPNHTHLVLRVDVESARGWSLRDVVERWHRLFSGTPISRAFLAKMPLLDAQRTELEQQVKLWRERLTSISWFMRCLNEPIARRANREDGCTGRFWEGRFRSQALLDKAAVLACMAYVDLNPVRAGMASAPECSAHTSIQRRIQALVQKNEQPAVLLPFVGNYREETPKGLAFSLRDYLELVDWSGRAIREDKARHIDQQLPPILQRLGLNEPSWLTLAHSFENLFHSLVGRPEQLEAIARQQARQWVRGIGPCRHYFSHSP
jgi:REP element-mobilizing transposase RayT